MDRHRLATMPRRVQAAASNALRGAQKALQGRSRRSVAITVGVVLAGVALCAAMARTIAAIAADPEGFTALTGGNLALAGVLYALINTVQVFTVFVPGEPLEIAAGYLFGVWGGVAVVSAGLALGELFLFVLVKRYGTRAAALFVSAQKLSELSFVKDARKLNTIAFLMMFIPGTPKGLFAYVVGLTPMRLGTWMALCVPARVLSIAASTVVGAQVAEANWGLAAAVFCATCAVSGFGVLYYLSIERQSRAAATVEELAKREWEANGRQRNDADVR